MIVNVAIVATVLALAVFKRHWLDDFARELNEAIDRFRGGGPPTPMHPSPAGDSEILRRK
jgi:hypothetical protein